MKILSIFSRRKVIGLYIGPYTVDLVVLKGTLKGPRLVKFAQIHIYPEKQDREEIIPEARSEIVSKQQGDVRKKQAGQKTREDYIVEAVQRVFRENNIKPVNVVTAIASEDAMVRYFQMPKIPKHEWSSAVNFEAKRYIPFRMEDVASDFQVTPSKTSPNSMDVLFVAVKHGVLERFVDVLEKAGVRPSVIEPASFSLIRVFNVAGQINAKINTAIVNIESSSANINILRKGVPYIIRVVPLDEGTSEGQSLEPVFEKLLAEIKLSLDFYEKQFPSEVIDKIIIYSHAPLEGWHELVGRELQVQVEVGDPLRGVRIKKDVVPPKLAIAFGLALRGISEPLVEVNLYRERLLIYRRKELFIRLAFLEASAAVFLLIIMKLLTMRALVPLTNELNRTLSERPKIEVTVKTGDIEELERIKNKMDRKRYLMEHIITSRTFFTSRMMDLVKFVPENMWLTEINFEEKVDKKDVSKVFRKLDIKGYCLADSRVGETDMINNFLLDLKQHSQVNKGMAKADIVSVQKTEKYDEKLVSFEILFTGP